MFKQLRSSKGTLDQPVSRQQVHDGVEALAGLFLKTGTYYAESGHYKIEIVGNILARKPQTISTRGADHRLSLFYKLYTLLMLL